MAPHILEQPEGKLIDNQDYYRQMIQWATKYPEEYSSVYKLNPAINLFEPPSSLDKNGISKNDMMSHNPPFMRYGYCNL